MSLEHQGANQFFRMIASKQERIMSVKRYDHSDYEDQIYALTSGLGRPTAAARAIIIISVLDRAFDQILLKTFILGAKLTGGKR